MRANELSALWRPRAGLDISSTLYALDIRDSITLVTLPDDTDQYRNVGQIRSRGLELEATQVFDSGLQARASWSLQQGVDRETGAALSDSPRSLFKLMVTAPGAVGRLALGANLLRMGERRTLADARLAPLRAPERPPQPRPGRPALDRRPGRVQPDRPPLRRPGRPRAPAGRDRAGRSQLASSCRGRSDMRARRHARRARRRVRMLAGARAAVRAGVAPAQQGTHGDAAAKAKFTVACSRASCNGRPARCRPRARRCACA